MHIEIDVPRPFATLMLLAAIGGGIYWFTQQKFQVAATLTEVKSSSSARVAVETYDDIELEADGEDAIGGEELAAQERIRRAEEEARRTRVQQEVLKRKADILRGELKVLEAEQKALGSKADAALEEQFRQSSRILTAMIQDQKRGEQFLLSSLNQIWEAQGRAIALGEGLMGAEGAPALSWPVEPVLGISAYFRDPSYEERFGFEHDAIDIPTPQNTVILAAADGTVVHAVDHGLGFNYVTIKHAGGVSTLYGHLTKFLVQSGDLVTKGTPIGYSGGRPGTQGAGLSTGPHLHLGVFKSGAAVDPLSMLSSIRMSNAGE